MDDKDVDSAVNQLIDQLNQTQTISKEIRNTDDPVKKENLEQFLLQYSGKLVKGSVDFVDDMKQFISSSPTSEDVEALAKLVASSAAAIESLNKILLANKEEESRVKLKNMDTDTKVKIKTMDIESRKQMQQVSIQGKLTMNREELLEKLLNEAKIVNVEATTVQTEKKLPT
jgi:hypothetical protein